MINKSIATFLLPLTRQFDKSQSRPTTRGAQRSQWIGQGRLCVRSRRRRGSAKVPLANRRPNSADILRRGGRGIAVGQITTDLSGDAELEFATDPDDPGEQAFPVGFPEVEVGTPITVGSVLMGAFATKHGPHNS